MRTLQTRKTAAVILIVLSFVFEGLMLYTDYSKLFDALNIICITAGICIYPTDTTKNRRIKLVMAIGILVILTCFVLLLTVMSLK